MIKINLIPPEYIEKVNRRAIIAKSVLGSLLVLAALSLLSVWQVTREATLAATMRKRTVELQALQGDVEKVKAIEAQISEVQRYLGAINSVAKGRFIYTRFLNDTALSLPATLWLGAASTTLVADTLDIAYTVNARSAYDLAYWIDALETSPDCSNVNLSGGIAVTESEGVNLFTTKITLRRGYK